MSQKNNDAQGRWRSRTIGFRVSLEEGKKIDQMVQLSGLTKQDYLTRNMLKQEIVVKGNPRVFSALKKQLNEIVDELKRISDSSQVDTEFSELVKYVCELTVALNERKK